MRTTYFAALLAATAALATDTPPKRAFEIADLYRTAFVGAPTLSPDGRHAVVPVSRYELEKGENWSELWLVALDGNSTRQLTTGRHHDGAPVFLPDGRLLFSSDRDDEGTQLWVMAVDGGEAKRLTDFPGGFSEAIPVGDGSRLVAATTVFLACGTDATCHEKLETDREAAKTKVHVADELLYRHWTSWADGTVARLVLLDTTSGKVLRDLTPWPVDAPVFSLSGARGYDVSPDGTKLVVAANRTPNQATSTNADLWLVDLADDKAEARNLTTTNTGWDGGARFSPDGKWLAYLSQERDGYETDLSRLAVLDLANGTPRYLTSRTTFDDHVGEIVWAPDSAGLLVQVERQGRTPLWFFDLSTGSFLERHNDATIAGFDLTPAGDRITYVRRSVGAPGELFVVPATGGGDAGPTRLTKFNDTLTAEVDIRPATEMWVDGPDGRKIHVFLVTPHGFDPSKKYPLILNVHGGPQSQWTDSYRGDWQVYPGKGYIVAFANPTGSLGYGQDFTDAIGCDWGGAVYDDLMAVTDSLEKLPYVDRERLGAMGWSYGGYMMMWFQGHTTRFKALAAMMGIYDLDAFWGETEELWFAEKDMCGVPWESAAFDRWSPSESAAQFATPSLVVTGEKDFRVSYTQSLQYFTTLRRRNIPARLVVFPESGHWPRWHDMVVYYAAHLEWFHRWLGGEPSPWSVEDLANGRVFGKAAD
jgi:dipeptidyl aminopeptidase/acylaminoacyl peptidase